MKYGEFELKRALFILKQGGAQGGARVERGWSGWSSTGYPQLINNLSTYIIK